MILHNNLLHHQWQVEYCCVYWCGLLKIVISFWTNLHCVHDVPSKLTSLPCLNKTDYSHSQKDSIQYLQYAIGSVFWSRQNILLFSLNLTEYQHTPERDTTLRFKSLHKLYTVFSLIQTGQPELFMRSNYHLPHS